MINSEYLSYIKSPVWKKKRQERLALDHHTCCVCGRPAANVHHLRYDHFGDERMDELVSLCHECHMKAEEIYEAKKIPVAFDKCGPDSFMAFMAIDAVSVAEDVFIYICKVNGNDLKSLLSLRESGNGRYNDYWHRLREIIRCLCTKRYLLNCTKEREIIAERTLEDHIVSLCLGRIEHMIRNMTQKELSDILWNTKEEQNLRYWKDVANFLDLPERLVCTLKRDDGSSAGPTLRQEVWFYFCCDATRGIEPPEDIKCLTDEDYRYLHHIVSHAKEIYPDNIYAPYSGPQKTEEPETEAGKSPSERKILLTIIRGYRQGLYDIPALDGKKQSEAVEIVNSWGYGTISLQTWKNAGRKERTPQHPLPDDVILPMLTDIQNKTA